MKRTRDIGALNAWVVVGFLQFCFLILFSSKFILQFSLEYMEIHNGQRNPNELSAINSGKRENDQNSKEEEQGQRTKPGGETHMQKSLAQ